MVWLDPSNVDVFGNIVCQTDSNRPIGMDLCNLIRAREQWFHFIG